MDGFTSFVFINIIHAVITLLLGWKLWQTIKALRSMHMALMNHAKSVAESLIKIRETYTKVLTSTNPMHALLLSAEDGARGCPMGEPGAEGEEGIPTVLDPNIPVDPDEEDDITTLGELM